MHPFPFEPTGQGWEQLAELGCAFVLSAFIGLEREYRQKSAGLRTYTVVGLGAALIMLVSKYGFTDVLRVGYVQLDPSRVAAQIVSGIGFIGGGVIFMRRDVVRGLTTAAIVWLTAGVGMACGAGLPILAMAVTAGHFIVVFAFPQIARRLPRAEFSTTQFRITYEGGQGVLRRALSVAGRRGFSVSDVNVEKQADNAENVVSVELTVQGVGDPKTLAAELGELDGTLSVHSSDVDDAVDHV